MPQFSARRLVAVPPEVAFSVAADVANYKAFLPLLDSSDILGPPTDSGGVTRFRARLAVAYAKLNIRESFVSEVTVNPSERLVTSVSQEAPFKDMKTVWRVREVQGRSEVSISIDYAMRSMLLQLALSGAMEMAVNKVMSAFETRAKAVHAAASSNSLNA